MTLDNCPRQNFIIYSPKIQIINSGCIIWALLVKANIFAQDNKNMTQIFRAKPKDIILTLIKINKKLNMEISMGLNK